MQKIKSVMENNVFILLYVCRKCPKHAVETFLLSVAGSVNEILSLLITRKIINEVQIEEQGELKNVIIYLFVLLLSNIVFSVLNNYIRKVSIPKNSRKIGCEIQAEIFSRSAVIEFKNYDDPEFYNLFSFVLQQSGSIAEQILDNFTNLVSSTLSIGVLTTLISVLNPFLLILVCINVLISFVISNIIAKSEHEMALCMQPVQRSSKYVQFLFYRVENAKEIQVNEQASSFFVKIFKKAEAELRRLIKHYGARLCKLLSFQNISQSILNTITMGYLAAGVILRRFMIGDFVTLVSSSQQLATQLGSIIGAFSRMYQHSLYIDRYKRFMDIPRSSNLDTGKRLEKINSVESQHIYFNYPSESKTILENIDFRIRKGEVVAIVGENGAGKSTFVKLLMGLYQPERGRLLINETDMQDYSLRTIRECISVAFQDYRVYAVSIAENILFDMFCKEKKAEQELVVYEALKWAGLYDKVISLPNKINTVLSKEFLSDGVVFSGGEVQKLILARAYAHKSSFYIFDEPSSSLDPIAEAEMYHKFAELAKDSCVLLISHRMNNLNIASCIYVFNNGRIVERGTHSELIAAKGYYYDMYIKQHPEALNI